MTASKSITLHKQLNGALTRMLRFAGVEIGPSVDGPVTTSPLEPLCYSPPEVWLDSAAFHLTDIWAMSTSLAEHLDQLASYLADERSIKGAATSAWGAVGDIRFHAFLFHLYAELMRDKLERSEKIEDGLWLWGEKERDERVTRLKLPAGSLERVLTRNGGISAAQAERVVRDVCDLYRACGPVCEAIGELASQRRGSLRVLCQCFVAVERAILQLCIVLLRADVACLMLMYHSPDEDE